MMRLRLLPVFTSLLLIASLRPAQSDESASVFGFAEHLFASEEYYRAITEFERFLYLYPDHAQSQNARLRIAEAYLDGGETDEGLTRLDALRRTSSEADISRLARLRFAGGLYAAGRYDDILLLPDTTDPELLALKGLCHLRHGAPDAGTVIVQKARALAFDGDACDVMLEAADRVTDVSARSPTTAGLMSAVLPGAGQLYVERPNDAMWAFLLNAVFISATYYAFDHGEDVAGAFALSAELVWYSGNIYNAANGAHKFNEDRQYEFFEDLDKRLPRESFSVLFYRTTF